ncbi:hypothetical protein [Bacillus cereus]|uniref:hypothetical protein n=1 Tax=Bacillus cereus TaxID=1396 RepID=UPI0014439F80|nr:hypothetical protein [Bacillus cereus]
MTEVKAPVDECPHCDSSEGYYTKVQISGSSICSHNFDGSEREDGDFHDSLNYKDSKFAYCIDCDKRIFKMADS